MDHSFGDLGSLMSSGPPQPLAVDWPALPSCSSNPWPLDYGTGSSSFFPHFVSTPTPASLLQFAAVSPYVMFPNLMHPVPPVADLHGLYYPSYDSCSSELCQEPSSSSTFSSVDSKVFPCPAYSGVEESGVRGPMAPYSYGISTLDSFAAAALPGTEHLQISLPMPPTFSQCPSSDTVAVEQEPHDTRAFNIKASKLIPSVCGDLVPAPLPCTSSPTRETEPPTTTTSIKEGDDTKSSSNQESRAESALTTATNSKNQGSKRRKAQHKRVVCVPASGGTDKPTGECLPSDSWAWRKYGQKPIKGSPYPRGYYRCSSSKGCTARKQVERSRSDPSVLIVTYTSDHNHAWPTHRNALAGTTRQSSLDKRSPDSCTVPSDGSCEPSDSIPLSSVVNSPNLQRDQPVSPAEITREGNLRLDQYVDLDIVVRTTKREDDFFAQLEELPDSFNAVGRNPLEERCEEEDGIYLVDPYNLFNWSSDLMW